jgi:peptide/nickel transport system substrate-binding protein
MKFVEWVEKDHITLTRNPDYSWAPAFFAHTGSAYLEKLTYRFYTDDPTRLAALESGDAQLITPIPVSNVKRIEADPKYQVNYAYNPGMPTVAFMNTTKGPTDDLAVRQALIQATDRKALIETGTFGTGKPVYGALWEGTPLYSKEVESLYPYDLDKAKQLLQGAGWVAGADGIRTKGGQKMTVLMNVTPSAASYDELFQSQMRAAGIDLQLTRGTAAAVTEAIVRGDINMALNGWVSSDPVVLTNMFHSKNNKSGYGWAKYADPKLDGLLEEGERTLDEAKRGQIYADVQKIIMQQALIIPLFASANTIGVHARYKDVKRDFRNYVWLYDAYIG